MDIQAPMCELAEDNMHNSTSSMITLYSTSPLSQTPRKHLNSSTYLEFDFKPRKSPKFWFLILARYRRGYPGTIPHLNIFRGGIDRRHFVFALRVLSCAKCTCEARDGFDRARGNLRNLRMFRGTFGGGTGGTEDESVMTSLKFEIDREVGYRRLSSSLRCVRGDDGMMDGRE